eukprot:scaffold1881_cov181-Ochromonas_danica.AAC.7
MAELKTEIADLKEEIKGHNNHLKVATSAQEKSEIRQLITSRSETLSKLLDPSLVAKCSTKLQKCKIQSEVNTDSSIEICEKMDIPPCVDDVIDNIIDQIIEEEAKEEPA